VACRRQLQVRQRIAGQAVGTGSITRATRITGVTTGQETPGGVAAIVER